MQEQKIAILVDSGSDIPAPLREQYHIYQVPLTLIFSNATYKDDAITSEQLYTMMEQEIPTTSLPTGEEITDMLRRISGDGYEKVLAISISSHLSGTCNMLRLNQDSCPGLEMEVVDSRNISIGSGMLALLAARLLEQGIKWTELKTRMALEIQNSKVFFYLRTLEYLRRGGRIGHVSALLGSALRIKPIITCDEEGVYITEAKVVGHSLALRRLSECAERFAAGAQDIYVSVMHGAAAADAAQVKERLLTKLPQAKILVEGQIVPSMAVHTGPGLVGIGVLRWSAAQTEF